jgi:hypothetical protein
MTSPREEEAADDDSKEELGLAHPSSNLTRNTCAHSPNELTVLLTLLP